MGSTSTYTKPIYKYVLPDWWFYIVKRELFNCFAFVDWWVYCIKCRRYKYFVYMFIRIGNAVFGLLWWSSKSLCLKAWTMNDKVYGCFLWLYHGLSLRQTLTSISLSALNIIILLYECLRVYRMHSQNQISLFYQCLLHNFFYFSDKDTAFP